MANDETSIPGLGIALGGGAFRGAVHPGALKALEEEGLQPNFLSGTSAGAMVAAFYAFGTPPEKIRELAHKLRWLRISSFTLPKLGLLSNAEIGNFMETHLGDVLLENALIPIALVAADIRTGERVVFKTGSVAEAVMASTCIPGVFTPVEVDGRLLVDGAIVENVPVSVLNEMGARVSVAIDLGSGRYRTPQGIVEVLLNAFAIAVDQTTSRQTESADVLIRPDLTGYSLMDSGNSAKLYAEGFRSATHAAEVIHEATKDAEPSSWETLEQHFRKWLKA